MASHLAARAMRRKTLPPLAARTASSRSRVRTAVFGAFVREVALGGGQLRLAGFAVESEIVERLEILGRDYGLGLHGIASSIGGAGACGVASGIR